MKLSGISSCVFHIYDLVIISQHRPTSLQSVREEQLSFSELRLGGRE